VLPAYPEAFLSVYCPFPRSGLVTQEIVFELIHTSIGEQQGRIILDYNGSGWYHLVLFTLEKIQKGLADLECVHHFQFSQR
jgi:hypothetical protein